MAVFAAARASRGPRANASASAVAAFNTSSAAGPVRRAPGRRLVGGHLPAGVDQIPGPPRPDRCVKRWVPPAPGITPMPDLRLTDLPVDGQVSQIGGERQLEPTAERVPVDRRDRDLRHRLEHVERVAERRHHRDGPPRARTRHGLDVRSRREDLRPAPDHHGPDVVAAVGLAERLLQLQPHLVVDRVGGRPVQTDLPHTVVDLEPDELPHAGSPYRSTPAVCCAVARSPSTSVVRVTPNAAAASGASARDGIANRSAAVGEMCTPERLEPRDGVGGRERNRRIGSRSCEGPDEIGHRHGVGALDRPGPLQASLAVVGRRQHRRDVVGEDRAPPTVSHRRSRTVAMPSRPRPWRPATIPPEPYACVDRTIACSIPLFATASSASPFARR